MSQGFYHHQSRLPQTLRHAEARKREEQGQGDMLNSRSGPAPCPCNPACLDLEPHVAAWRASQCETFPCLLCQAFNANLI